MCLSQILFSLVSEGGEGIASFTVEKVRQWQWLPILALFLFASRVEKKTWEDKQRISTSAVVFIQHQDYIH